MKYGKANLRKEKKNEIWLNYESLKKSLFTHKSHIFYALLSTKIGHIRGWKSGWTKNPDG